MSDRPTEENVQAVRLGHGANCSSIGSVLDLLFASAAVGAAVFAAAAAALASDTKSEERAPAAENEDEDAGT